MLDLEQPLIEEIARIPELIKVYGMADFDDLVKAGKPMPCAFVIYDGYRVVEANRQRRKERILAAGYTAEDQLAFLHMAAGAASGLVVLTAEQTAALGIYAAACKAADTWASSQYEALGL